MKAQRHTHSTRRIEFLSDGIFAIALTLLTIDVVGATKAVPPGMSLAEHLFHEWPAILAYPIGFATLMVIWINHHRIFEFVKRADSGLIWINALILVLVAGTPIPTALLAEHVPGPDESLPMALYLSTFVLMPALFWLLWLYADWRGLIDREEDPEGHGGMRWIYPLVTIWDSIALGIAFFSVWLSLAMLAASFAVIAFPAEVSRAIARRMARGQGSSGPA